MYVKGDNNISFKRIRQELQLFGVNNNEFMMYLKDPSLADFKLEGIIVSNTDEERKYDVSRVCEECKSNVWFFFREIAPTFDLAYDHYPWMKQSDFPRFFLSPTATKMIYLYSKGISFAVDMDCHIMSIKRDKYDKEIITSTFLLLALYENLFLYNKLKKNIFIESGSGVLGAVEVLDHYIYNTIDISDKGLFDPSSIIAGLSGTNTAKFCCGSLDSATILRSIFTKEKYPVYALINDISGLKEILPSNRSLVRHFIIDQVFDDSLKNDDDCNLVFDKLTYQKDKIYLL